MLVSLADVFTRHLNVPVDLLVRRSTRPPDHLEQVCLLWGVKVGAAEYTSELLATLQCDCCVVALYHEGQPSMPLRLCDRAA